MLGDSPGGLTPDPLVALEEGGAAQPHNLLNDQQWWLVSR